MNNRFYLSMLFVLSSYSFTGHNVREHMIDNTYELCDEVLEDINCNEPIVPIIRFGLDNPKDLKTFIKYIKTQSNRIDTELGRTDVYYVMQTIFNRMEDAKCTWNQYYNNKSINHSHSIKCMKTGVVRPSYNPDNAHDSTLINMAYMANIGALPEYYTLPKCILYFRSGKNFRNKSPHLKENLYTVIRHHFYFK